MSIIPSYEYKHFHHYITFHFFIQVAVRFCRVTQFAVAVKINMYLSRGYLNPTLFESVFSSNALKHMDDDEKQYRHAL